jgi:hypothetical protein
LPEYLRVAAVATPHSRGVSRKIIGTARLKAFAVPFEMAFKASEDVRHLNVVVVVTCVNELSLLSGFLGRFFLGAAFFCGLLLSCHSVVSPSLAFWL